MWAQYPKHLMEPRRVTPTTPVEYKPDRPIKEKRRIPHKLTKAIRHKFAFEDKNHLS